MRGRGVAGCGAGVFGGFAANDSVTHDVSYRVFHPPTHPSPAACPAGTYDAGAGGGCTACPAGRTSPAGSLSASACGCPVGWAAGGDGVCRGPSIGGPADTRNATSTGALVCPQNQAPVGGACSVCPLYSGTAAAGAQACALRHYARVVLAGVGGGWDGGWTATAEVTPGGYPVYQRDAGGGYYLQLWPASSAKGWYVTSCASYGSGCPYYASFAATVGKALQAALGSGSYALCGAGDAAYDYAGRRVCYCPAGQTPDAAGSSSGGACVPCPVGSYHAAGVQSDACVACAAGANTVYAGSNATGACVATGAVPAPLTTCTGGRVSTYTPAGTAVFCACPPGTTDGGVAGGACVDVNECAAGNGGCAGTCVNAYGGYACGCPAGQALAADGRGCAACPAYMAGNGTHCVRCPEYTVAAPGGGPGCVCPYALAAGGSCLPPAAVSLTASTGLALTLSLARVQYVAVAGGASAPRGAAGPFRVASPVYATAVDGGGATLYWAHGGAWAANGASGAAWAVDRNPAVASAANGSAPALPPGGERTASYGAIASASPAVPLGANVSGWALYQPLPIRAFQAPASGALAAAAAGWGAAGAPLLASPLPGAGGVTRGQALALSLAGLAGMGDVVTWMTAAGGAECGAFAPADDAPARGTLGESLSVTLSTPLDGTGFWQLCVAPVDAAVGVAASYRPAVLPGTGETVSVDLGSTGGSPAATRSATRSVTASPTASVTGSASATPSATLVSRSPTATPSPLRACTVGGSGGGVVWVTSLTGALPRAYGFSTTFSASAGAFCADDIFWGPKTVRSGWWLGCEGGGRSYFHGAAASLRSLFLVPLPPAAGGGL